jgi:hypothetical protein
MRKRYVKKHENKVQGEKYEEVYFSLLALVLKFHILISFTKPDLVKGVLSARFLRNSASISISINLFILLFNYYFLMIRILQV